MTGLLAAWVPSIALTALVLGIARIGRPHPGRHVRGRIAA